MEDQSDIVSLIRDREKQGESALSGWRKEAKENYDMVAGDGRQWAKEDRAKLLEEERPCVEFNRLGTIVDAVSGSEVNNRQEVSYIPRVLGDVQKTGVANLRTAAAKWVRDNCDAEDEESDAFADVLISGVGCTYTRMDYEEEEDGKVVIERIDPLMLNWDPAARKKNLSDAKWISCKQRMRIEDVKERWPAKADEISSLEPEEEEGELHIVDPKNYYDDDEKRDEARGLVDVIHHQWYVTESVYKVLDPVSGQILTMPEEKFQVVTKLFPQAKYAKQPRRKYMQAFICGQTELEAGEAPCQHGFTYQVITGKRDRNKGYWYGLVRPMKDPQRWANKFFSQILHIINVNAKGGILYETGAVDNVRKLEEKWAKADSAIPLKAGGLAKIMPKPTVQIPNSLFQLMDFSISSIRDSSGVNLELLGMVDREQAGVLEEQRTKAGLTILAPFFDSLRLYRKRHGRVLAYFINEYISDGRLIRVAGPQGEQFIQLMKQPDDVDYDVVVDDAPTSRDTKEKAWMALQMIIPMFVQSGAQVPPEVFDYAPLPDSLNAAFKKAYMQKLQQGQSNPMQEAEVADKRASAEQKESAAALNYMKAGAEGVNMLATLMGPQPNAGQMPQAPMQQQPPLMQ